MVDEKLAIGSIVRNALIEFGLDINTNRQLVRLEDGLKPVYRRAIYTMLQQGKNMYKTASIVGKMIGTVHPHGDKACEQPISNLVNWGIAEGQGNHGKIYLRGEDSERSAPRYTEARLSDKFLSIFSDLMSYVPYVPSELPGFEEPLYLPTPVPLGLLFGTLGIGYGVGARIPCFEIKSLLKAFVKDDPNLLEAPFGMILDKENSELDSLWNKGVGKITYKYKVYHGESASGSGTYIEGEPFIFKPRTSKLEPLVDLGRIYILDESDSTGSRLFVGRNYNIKSISYDEILDLCREISTNTKTYRLTVAQDDKVFLIPLKEWLSECYSTYSKIFSNYKADKIKKLEFDKLVYSNLSKVAELIFDNRDITVDEIVSKLNLDKEVVSSILSKSINTLRNEDGASNKLIRLEEKLSEFNSMNVNDKILDIINEI